MENLIKALRIFLKYGNPKYPTHCEHDTLYICGINWSDISEEDQLVLREIGFHDSDEDDDNERIYSFRYGHS